MIALFFTFAGDSECLHESVATFRAAFDNPIVAVCDDGNKPITEHVKNAIAPDHYEKRTWNSNGNLNGWDTVKGIIDFQIRMHEKFDGHKGAIKIDCDTLIFNGSWIDEDAPACGIDSGGDVMMIGMCRYLTLDAAMQIRDFLTFKFLWNNYKVKEDAVIASSAFYLFGPQCKRMDWTDVAFAYNYINETCNNKIKPVVAFGNRREIKAGSPCDKRAIAGMHMAKYRIFAKNLQQSGQCQLSANDSASQ
jgi:hypothetical protein